MVTEDARMKFIVKSFESTSTEMPQRVYNTQQVPEVGSEYDMTANGWVVGMNARVVVDEEGGWLWYPIPSSYSSYYFQEIPFRITVKTVDVSEKMSKMFARWSNVARPALLPRERVERPDIGVDRAIMNLRSSGF
jgi:hypothetical protein